jgi:copper transport protein
MTLLHAAGLVLAAGIPAFWATTHPGGSRDRRLRALLMVGAAVSAVAAVADPLLRWADAGRSLTQVVSREAGAAVLLELALLVLLVGFVDDLAADSASGRTRVVTGGLAVGLAATVAAQSAAQAAASSGQGSVVTWLLLTLHLAAMATWVGGFAALLAMALRRERLDELDDPVLRFLPVSYACLAVLAVTGAVHALVVAGGLGALGDTAYAGWLLFKIGLVVVMVVVGSGARNYALDVTFRRSVAPAPVAPTVTVRALTVTLAVELVTAVAVLGATAFLVAAAPV